MESNLLIDLLDDGTPVLTVVSSGPDDTRPHRVQDVRDKLVAQLFDHKGQSSPFMAVKSIGYARTTHFQVSAINLEDTIQRLGQVLTARNPSQVEKISAACEVLSSVLLEKPEY